VRASARTHLSYTDQKGTVTKQMRVLGFEQYIPVTDFDVVLAKVTGSPR
jgi:hypothetical protein